MAGINDYSNTAGSNTTINGIDIAEGCSPAGINNAIRQLMADIADMDDGVVPLQTPDINGGTIDGATIGGSSTIDNSIIGGTTPAAGTFTNLTATGTLTGLLGNVVEDVTPQLGGDLDLNSNDITGTGNINITGTATVSGDLTVDTNTLKVDSSNNVVMVGLTSSLISNDAKLQVAHTNGNADIIVHRAGDNANPPSLNFQKTRNASIGNYGTIVQNNDELGSIRWGGADGSNIGFAARIVGAVDGTPGANDMPGRLQFHTSPDGTENLTERMRIDSSGNVGIGTSSPATKTHIFNGSDNANILFIQGADTTTENIFFGVETGKSTITAGGSSSTNNSLVFRASNAGAETEYMRITNTGNVGIGTSSPTSGGGLTLSSSTTAQGFIDFKHTVDGDSGYIGNAKALITGATTNQLGVRGGTNGIAFGVGATEAMRIDSSGNVGIGNIPETWYSTFSALQIGANKSAIYGRSENNQLSLASNSYVNASGNNTYINSSEASLYEQNSGVHKFFTAPSGTAGNSITFTERMRINSSGNVGINTSSPSSTLDVNGVVTATRIDSGVNCNFDDNLNVNATGGLGFTQGSIKISSSTIDSPSGRGQGVFMFNEGYDQTYYAGTLYGNQAYGIGSVSSTALNTSAANRANSYVEINYGTSGTVFNENSVDRDFRVESNNNSNMLKVDGGTDTVLMAKGSVDNTTAGHRFNSDGFVSHVRSGNGVMRLNRLSNDGNILEIYKDGATVGNIGTYAGDITIGTTDTGLRFDDGASAYIPWNISTNSATDGTISLGATTVQYNNLYLSGTVTNDGSGGMSIDTSGNVTFNEGSIDADFRVESNNNTHMLFVDGGNNCVGINTSVGDASSILDIQVNNGYLRVKNGRIDATNNVRLEAGGSTSNFLEYRGYLGHIWDVNTTEVMRLGTSEAVINDDSLDYDFRVESNNKAYMLFVDGGNDRVSVGTSAPLYDFHVAGQGYFDSTAEKPLFVHHSDGNNVKIGFQNNTSNANFIGFNGTLFQVAPNGTSRMTVSDTGTVTATAFSGDGSALTGISSGAGSVEAWANFNGIGTLSIRASGNVSSITDQATGRFRVNFSSALTDANFAVAGATAIDDGGATGSPNGTITIQRSSTPMSSSYVDITTSALNAVNQDHEYSTVMIVR